MKTHRIQFHVGTQAVRYAICERHYDMHREFIGTHVLVDAPDGTRCDYCWAAVKIGAEHFDFQRAPPE